MADFLSQYGGMILSLVAVGLFAGLVAGMFGIGGGAVIVPVLFFLFDGMGFSETAMHVAVSTSLATIILTSARSVVAHHGHGAVDWGMIRSWTPWIMFGAACGIGLSGLMSNQMLLGLFGTLLVLLAAQMIFGRPGWRLADQMPTGAARAGLGIGIGTLSALMGIGGGTFGVSLMTLFATLGFVNLPAFALISVFTVLTAPVGAALAHRLPADNLRKLFGALLVLVAGRMVWKALGL